MKRLKFIITSLAALVYGTSAYAQDWETLETPVITNLILYQISFPTGQENFGYTGGSSVTYNGQGKILKTTDQGDTWEVIWESAVNGTGVSAIYFSDLDNGLAGTQGGDLMVTSDGGLNWTSSDIDPNNDQGEIVDIDFFDNMNGVLLSNWGGVYITSDGGMNWQPAAITIPGAAHAISYAGDASTLFAAGDQQKIFKSEDGGNSWTLNNTGPYGWMINLGVHFDNNGNGLVTSEDGEVFVTHDGGDSWSNFTVPGQGGLMRGALVLNANDMYITATPGAVYKSTNGGIDWTLDSEVNPNPSYYSIISTDEGTLFVSGSGSTGGTILRKTAAIELNFDVTAFPVLCNGDSTGSISVVVSNGVEPYFYLWSNGETTSTITDLPAGSYSCLISDSDGNSINAGDILVMEPTALAIDLEVTDETFIGASDGTITATVSGGTAPYTYVWCNGESGPSSIMGMPAGECCLTIIDGNACEASECVTINSGTTGLSDLSVTQTLEVFPNPVVGGRNCILQMKLASPTDLQIEITDVQGKSLLNLIKPNTNMLYEILDISSYNAGIYTVKIIDLQSGFGTSKKIVKVD